MKEKLRHSIQNVKVFVKIIPRLKEMFEGVLRVLHKETLGSNLKTYEEIIFKKINS